MLMNGERSYFGEGNLFPGNLQFWMTNIPPSLKRLSIIHLAIPGSHNSMTYTIQRFNEVGPDEPHYLQFFGRFCPLISKPLIYNWSVTQYEDVVKQLNGGIRYLDLRLAKRNSEIYVVHGLYGAPVTESLIAVNAWMAEHPFEVVILDCQHFYSFAEGDHLEFVKKLKRIYGHKMCPYDDLRRTSLRWFADRGYQVVVIYRHELADVDGHLWPSNCWPTPWPNTVDPIALVSFLDARLRTRLLDLGFVSQCLLTPDTGYVLRHLCGNLHRDLTAPCRAVSLPWIRANKPGAGNLNILISDFVSYENFLFSKTVIQRNIEHLRSPEVAALPAVY